MSRQAKGAPTTNGAPTIGPTRPAGSRTMFVLPGEAKLAADAS